MRWKDASKHQVLISAIVSNIPDYLRLDVFVKNRKDILNSPAIILNKKAKNAFIYALISTSLPFLISFFIISSLTSVDLIPKSSVSQDLQQDSSFISEANKFRDKVIKQCETIYMDKSQQRYCKEKHLGSIGVEISQVEQDRKLLVFSQKIDGGLVGDAGLFQSLSLILNCYIFSYLFLKKYPRHASLTKADLDMVRRAYLFTMGTTLFWPNCLASLGYLLGQFLDRYDEFARVSHIPILLLVSGLPIITALSTGSARIHNVLNGENNWRFGSVMIIMLKSNIITNLSLMPIIIIFYYISS